MTSAHPTPTPTPTDAAQQPARTSIAHPEAGALLKQRQRDLMDRYRKDPDAAWTIDHASTRACNGVDDGPLDPLHTHVHVGESGESALPIGVHRAVGGFSDLPVPGDVLCAALASCADSTIRVVANLFGIELLELSVDVRAEVDVRGTLCVSPETPVGFQAIHTDVRLRAAPGTSPARLERLVQTAEHCCVVMRTLRDGVPVTVSCDAGEDS